MSLKKDIQNEIKTARKLRLSWWMLLCVFIGSLFFSWLFDYWGRLDLALPVLNAIGVMGFFIAVQWKMRVHFWFWLTLALVAALHVILILVIPWGTKWVPATAIAGIDTIDFCALLVIFAVVEKLMEGHQRSQ